MLFRSPLDYAIGAFTATRHFRYLHYPPRPGNLIQHPPHLQPRHLASPHKTENCESADVPLWRSPQGAVTQCSTNWSNTLESRRSPKAIRAANPPLPEGSQITGQDSPSQKRLPATVRELPSHRKRHPTKPVESLRRPPSAHEIGIAHV